MIFDRCSIKFRILPQYYNMEIFDKVNYIKIEPALIAIHIDKIYKICIHTDYTRNSNTDHCTCSSDCHTQPEMGECGHEAPISNQSVNGISIQPATVSLRAITGLLTPIGHTQITKNRLSLYSMAGTHKAIVQ